MSKKNVIKNLVTLLLFFCNALFMNAFYKSLSGFIANNFNDPVMMITMLVSYIVPVVCFLFYFYNYYVRKINNKVNIVYSIVVILLAILTLVLISINFEVYAANNSLGVYQSIPSIIVMYPYDSIIVSILLILVQIYNLFVVFKPNHKLSTYKERNYNLNLVKLNVLEYSLISVLAILALFTVGDFVCGFNAIKNTLYDSKYIFLMLWVLIIPTGNMLCFVFKFENKFNNNLQRNIYLSSLIFINVLFGILLWIFEVIDPSFIVNVGKPLFPIAFSISFPVEMLVLLGIQLVSILINGGKMIFISKKKI